LVHLVGFNNLHHLARRQQVTKMADG
jgi:hypothetical protein